MIAFLQADGVDVTQVKLGTKPPGEQPFFESARVCVSIRYVVFKSGN